MRRLFVDASDYFALTDKRDENHEAAVYFIYQLIKEHSELFTTNYIVAETHTLLLNRIGYATALQVLDELYKSQTRIYRVREAEERKALEIIKTDMDKEFSLVDASCQYFLEWDFVDVCRGSCLLDVWNDGIAGICPDVSEESSCTRRAATS